jgi:hypothetical protein
MTKKIKNSKMNWSFVELSPKELIVTLIIIGIFIFFTRWLAAFSFRRKNLSKDEVAVINPKINELTIQEYGKDLKKLESRLENLNNKFLVENKNIMANEKVFSRINKNYLELRLRLNHINKELNLKENKQYKTPKIQNYESKLKRIKSLLELLNEELQRETEKSQANTLKRITMIQLTFLPLGFIAGFFGMNFSSPDGKLMFAPLQVTSDIGLSVSQIYILLLMIFSSIIIGFVFNFQNVESFDIRETQACNETKKIIAYNEEELNSLQNRQIEDEKKEIPSIFELPYDDILFYKMEN